MVVGVVGGEEESLTTPPNLVSAGGKEKGKKKGAAGEKKAIPKQQVTPSLSTSNKPVLVVRGDVEGVKKKKREGGLPEIYPKGREGFGKGIVVEKNRREKKKDKGRDRGTFQHQKKKKDLTAIGTPNFSSPEGRCVRRCGGGEETTGRKGGQREGISQEKKERREKGEGMEREGGSSLSALSRFVSRFVIINPPDLARNGSFLDAAASICVSSPPCGDGARETRKKRKNRTKTRKKRHKKQYGIR
jgi:hypothetical protein